MDKEKNSQNAENEDCIPKDSVIMMRAPMEKYDPSEIAEHLNEYISNSGLACMYASVFNQTSWLMDELNDDPPGCTREVYNKWRSLEDELYNKIINIIKQWNEDGATYTIKDTGTIANATPYMDKNGYRNAGGWWVKKSNDEN